jgi:hypothetical protein
MVKNTKLLKMHVINIVADTKPGRFKDIPTIPPKKQTRDKVKDISQRVFMLL